MVSTASSSIGLRRLTHWAGCTTLLVICSASNALTQAPADYKAVSISLEDVPYPHAVSFMPMTIYGQDVRLAYMDVQPSGPANGRTVVLLHGGNFYGEYWAGTIEVLRNEGFRVIVPDRIGYGRSSKPIIPYTLHDMAYHTKKLLDLVGVRAAAIVGHSMGGVVATRFAFAYPQMTTHLVLENQIGLTDARLGRPWRDPDEALRAGLDRSYADSLASVRRFFVTWRPEFEKLVRIDYGWTLSGEWPRLVTIRALIGQALYMDPIVYDWPHIKAKTLVIGGANDTPDFPELAKRSADAIPNAELVLIPNVGHIPHLEVPGRFHAELIRFLKSDPITSSAQASPRRPPK